MSVRGTRKSVGRQEELALLSVIDAHVHLWDLSRRPQPWIDPEGMAVIHRDFGVAELAGSLAEAGVSGAVLVQVLNDAGENADYLTLAEHEVFLGLVGWVDLLDEDLRPQLETMLSGAARLVGIRHQALAEPDPEGWLRRAAAQGSLRLMGELGLAVDLMFLPRHLGSVARVVGEHPATSFVLDHAGKPPIATGWSSEESARWASLVVELSLLPNLTCKLSGLTTMASLHAWTVADLTPYVDHLLETFGPQRLVFGSDWPVSLRAGTYPRTVTAARAIVAALSSSEQDEILSNNARRVYSL